MKQLTIPDTGLKLIDGSIVILAEYPNTKWITHYGWYNYNDQQQMGWYFCSIPDQTILPVTSDNLQYVTLVSDSGGCSHRPHLPPPPKPVPIIPQPELIDQINRSFITVDTISERDDLDTKNFPTGKLVRVNNVEGQPKYYQWDQTKKRWLPTTFEDSVNSFIYFKKECDNWSTPRIYFFISEPYILSTKEQNECWDWQDSPYMLQNGEGYYYYPLIKGYDNVIFFSDETDNSNGFNYKTSDLRIPSNEWFRNPLFVQSEIGYDGFWADYNTKQTKLLVQLNQDLYQDINLYRDSSLSAEYIDSQNNLVIPKIYDFGMIQNGGYYSSSIKSLYKYVELPIDFSELKLNIECMNRSSTFNLKRYEMCYEYPVAYASTTSISLQYFNAILDPNLKYKLVDNRRELDYRVSSLEDKLSVEFGRIPYASNSVASGSTVRNFSISDCWYYRIGRIVYFGGSANTSFVQGSSIVVTSSFSLPYPSSSAYFQGNWVSENEYEDMALVYIPPNSDKLKFMVSGTGSFSHHFSISYVI